MDKLAAGINFDGHGLAQSINAMQMDMDIMGIFGENVVGFDKVGYQKKEAVISSFAEFIGSDALSYSTDEQVGRIAKTKSPLDVALSQQGYFQVLNNDGTIELTRDGRFQINKNGELLTQTNQKVLSKSGMPIILPVIPDDLSKISIGKDGKISVFDEKARKLIPVTKIGLVNKDGSLNVANCFEQGYVESSNVQPEREFIDMINYKRSFEANRQMFKLQNSKLSSAISRLSQA